MDYRIMEDGESKCLASEEYNYAFNKRTGFFARWGRTLEDDPQWSPFGPEILDLEISAGECSGRCPFCYKGNGDNAGLARNMSLGQFEAVLSKMPDTLTQIAFGICDIWTNPDFVPMMEHARSKGVIPNYTCNGSRVTDEWARTTARLCGAVAVSVVDKDVSYDAIRRFVAMGMTQCNIHCVLAAETYDRAMGIVEDVATDPRLTGMNAVVFLQYKHKNRGSRFHSMLDNDRYRKLVSRCEELGVNYGFDSCSCTRFLESMEGHKDYDRFVTVSEPCESTLFSSYINHDGRFSPCSFCEGTKGWEDGIDVLNCNSFVDDVWLHPRVGEFRKSLLANKRSCTVYNI